MWEKDTGTLINEIIHEKWENGHYDKASDKDNIEISANTNTLKSEMILKCNYDADSDTIIPLLVS